MVYMSNNGACQHEKKMEWGDQTSDARLKD